MRYFPGVVFCLMAVAIFVYNLYTPQAPFNLPFIDQIAEASNRAERGVLTWQILAGVGVTLIAVALVLQLARPGTEALIHDGKGDDDLVKPKSPDGKSFY